MTITSVERIATLDILRGIAVMGILAVNVVAFGDVAAAYFNPLAQTAALRTGDLIVYAVNFILIDGKMRGLFSLLFGASLLLVAEKMSIATVRRRLLWLLLFGMIHFFFIWWGDILIGYALVGFLALAFRDASPRGLIVAAAVVFLVEFALMIGTTGWALSLQSAIANGTATPEQLLGWDRLTRDTVMPSDAWRAKAIALYLGPWWGIVQHQFADKPLFPLFSALAAGWEWLGFMLLGMASLKSGLLTGEWDDRRYRRWALVSLGIALPCTLIALRFLFRSEFAATAVFAWLFTAPVLLRPVMVIGYICLIILLTRRGGAMVERIAAAGRAAFSNYLGTSILMTGIFYGWGLGLFARLGRIELMLVVIAAWALMLLWSKPWLGRFRYGPLEWAWRSLTYWRLEPMRRPA